MKKILLAFISLLFMLFIATSVADWPMLGSNLQRTSYGTTNLAIRGAVQVEYADSNFTNLAWTPLTIVNGNNTVIVLTTNLNKAYGLNYTTKNVTTITLQGNVTLNPMLFPTTGYEYILFPTSLGLEYFNLTSKTTGTVQDLSNVSISTYGACGSPQDLIVIGNNTLYVLNSTLNLINNQTLGSNPTAPLATYNDLIFVPNGTSILALNCSKLEAGNNITNSEVWQVNISANWITVDGSYLLVTDGSYVYKLNTSSGAEVSNSTITGAGMMATDGDVLYVVGSTDTKVLNTSGSGLVPIGAINSTGKISATSKLDGTPGIVVFSGGNNLECYYITINGTNMDVENVSCIISNPVGQAVIDNLTNGEIVVANSTGVYVLEMAPDITISGVNFTKNNFTSTVTNNGTTINITFENITLNNIGEDISEYYNGTNISVKINNQLFNQTTAEKFGNSITLTGSNVVQHNTPGAWSIPIEVDSNIPDSNTTNNYLSLTSPILQVSGNWTINSITIPFLTLVNTTVGLHFNVSSAGTNSTVSLYLFAPNGNKTGEWSFTNNTSSWSINWTHTYNETGNWTLIAVVDKQNGLPAWWKYVITVKTPINLSQLSSLNGTLTLTYNGTKLNLSEPIPLGVPLGWEYKLNATTNITIKGTVKFAGVPKFNITKIATGTGSVEYTFEDANVTFQSGLMNITGLSGLKISDTNLTVWHCSGTTCTKLTAGTDYSYISTNGIVDTVYNINVSKFGFTSYKINETSTTSTSSTSSSTSSSSSSSTTSTSEPSGGGTTAQCDYYSKIQVPDKITIYKGVQNTIKFIVENDGTCSDIYMPDISGIPESWYKLSPTSIEIEPGKTYTFTLIVTPDETGNYTLKILLERTWKTVDLSVVSQQPKAKSSSEVEILPKEIELEGGMTQGTIEIMNSGNTEIDMNISLVGNISEIASVPSAIKVMPNKKATITISLANKTGLFTGYVQLTYNGKTEKIPITVNNVPKKPETATTGGSSLWIIIPIVLVILIIIGGAVYHKDEILDKLGGLSNKRGGGLASVKPRYKPKKIKR